MALIGRRILAEGQRGDFLDEASYREFLPLYLPPLLLFWGREDATPPFEQSARLLELLSGAEFRCIEGAGHVPQWEKAEEANSVLLEFLSMAWKLQ